MRTSSFSPRRFFFLLIAVMLAFCACGGGDDAATEGDKSESPKGPKDSRMTLWPPTLPSPAEGEIVLGAAGQVRYTPVYKDPVLESLRAENEAVRRAAAAAGAEVRKRQQEMAAATKAARRELVASLAPGEYPASPEQFTRLPHQPPTAQYLSGTCWAFAAVSLLESEAMRLKGVDVKLSEIYPVYYEYLAKAEGYIAERGELHWGEGSQDNAVFRAIAAFGLVPESAYSGSRRFDQRHNHGLLFEDLTSILQLAKRDDMRDPNFHLDLVRVVLNRHLGAPPETFAWGDVTYTPQAFMSEVLGIDPSAYVDFISTAAQPFYKKGVYDVPDNWWRDANYHNLPLDEFMGAFKRAIERGFTVTIAIDTSEPGRDAENDVMFIPDFDIPPNRIDQVAREMRLANGSTTDDHGVHVVGTTHHQGHMWYLAKDSGRSARRGRHAGYYFIREDYLRLKMLAFSVHRDAVPEFLTHF